MTERSCRFDSCYSHHDSPSDEDSSQETERVGGAGGTSKLIEVYDHDYSLNYETEHQYWFVKRHNRLGQNQFVDIPPQWIPVSIYNTPS